MNLTCPNCKEKALERIGRRWWMRLVPTSRLYRCYICLQEHFRLLTPKIPPNAKKNTVPYSVDDTCSVNHYFAMIDDVIYGPATLIELQQWAKDGRLHGSHKVSRNECNDWQEAATIEALELRCMVRPDATSDGYRLHPEAAQSLMQEGAIPANWIMG